jgi:predicted porin
MKKSLIALAALAAVSAASAQSSVTLYGIVDTYFGQTSAGVGAADVSNTVINSGGLSTSRWGVKGSEDLGGGLKANFTLEAGFKSDDGTATAGFDRKSTVGISGAFGAVDIGGRMLSSYDDVFGFSNMLLNSNAALTAKVWNLTGEKSTAGTTAYTNRLDQSIKFTTAKMNGFSGSLQYAGDENKTTTLSASSTTSMNVMYANGPLVAGVGFQSEEKTAGQVNSMDSTIFGATYNLGVAKVVGSYNTIKFGLLEAKGYQIGVDFPVNAMTTVSAGYASNKSESSGVTTSNSSGFALQGIYALSKRTNLYTIYNKLSSDNNAGTDLQDASTLGFGVRHSF